LQAIWDTRQLGQRDQEALSYLLPKCSIVFWLKVHFFTLEITVWNKRRSIKPSHAVTS
jgi:hypothetical protein